MVLSTQVYRKDKSLAAISQKNLATTR
jgi:hypothetical protein